uniref:Putative reverse transcriptase n=1 Tax=Ixodes ricinus TaxID=34613 RepID=A0A6B0VGQ0_IXORI
MVAEIRAGRGSLSSVRPLEPDCLAEVGSRASSATTDTSLVVDAPVPALVHPPSPQRASPSSSSSTLAASDFLRPAATRVPATTGGPLEMDPGLLRRACLGLLSEGAGDTGGLRPVGDDAAVASSSAASSAGAHQVPGHSSPRALESHPRQTSWASRLRRRPAAVTLPPLASPSSGDSSSSESWDPDSTDGHPSARESLGQAADSPLWGGRLGQGRPGGGRATLHSRPRQSGALPETTRRGGSALSQDSRLREGEDHEGVPGTPSREALLRALREAVEEEPPGKFQGQRLWAVARDAISGADYLRPINDYIRDVFFLDQRRSPPQSSRRALPRESRRRRRRREYARTQEMFSKRPADCAREVLDGPAEAGVEDVRGFLATWAGIMTGPLPPPIVEPLDKPDEEVDIFYPITAKELREARFPLNSAPGPDGFTARLLRAVPSTILRVLLNLLMLLGRVPAALQAGRTVFIPKTSPATEAGHFRLITMAPVVQRLLHKILARRLATAVGLNFRQRAFQPVDGCAENVLLLATAIAEAKQRLRPLYMASIDLTKAFDRVSTEAIVRGALRADLADNFVAYLRDLYRTSQSILNYKGESLLVEPTTGVRQGDPLSLTMFNLVLDEYLSKTDVNVGFTSGEFRLDAKAFADDLLVFASTRRGLQERLDELAEFLEPRGLRINVAKSFSLVLQPSGREKKSKVETDMTFCVRDQPLPVATTATIWRYLGVQFSTGGRRRGGVDRDLRELLERVTRAPLKPQQRLFILRGFLLPRLHHRLVLGLWGVGTLSKLDKLTRAAIRKWLALPHNTPVGYFHAPVSEGGLGVTSLRTAIPGMTLTRIQGLRFSDHPGCEAALQCRMLTDQVRRARQAANLDGVSLTTKADVHRYWAGKLHSSYDGAALRETRHVPAAQSWVSDGTRLLPGRHFVNVIKLRVNALPTLSRTKRGRPDDVSCRAGCRARESLGHVLQACHRGHRGRVKRHDNIARYIAMRLHQLEWTVLWEPHYTVQGRVMKPDLVATMGAQAVIIDVQVVGTGLELAFLHQQKAAKYSVPDLLRQVQGKRTEPPMVTTAPMNFRGVWSRDCARDLLSLGLIKSDLKLMTVRCLQGGLRCFWAHRRMTTVASNHG